MDISVFLISFGAVWVIVWLIAKLITWFISWADRGIAETFQDRYLW